MRPSPGRAIRDLLAQSARFFARLHSFALECPHCGSVYLVGGRLRDSPNWDPTTARFRCSTCARVYVLGLLAWPVAPGRAAHATPEDQVPGPRELITLRKEGGGWWLPDTVRQAHLRPTTTNLTTEEDRPDGPDTDDQDTDD